MKFKRYPNCKDSGVEWLGEIPEHWEVKRLKYCVDLVRDKSEGRETELPYMGLENIESWTGRQILIREQVLAVGQSNLFRSGDVLFGKLRPYLAKAFRATESGICTGELLVLRPKDTIQNYIFNYLLSKQFIQLVDSSTYGAKMPRADWEFIGNLTCPVPPIKEQKAVADFLERETGKIDALIEKKERLIELLKEKRTALIAHAVTKGLDPNGPMKDSGVEWIGEIPEHWKLVKGKRIFQLMNGYAFKGEYFSKESGEGPIVVTPGNFNVDGGLYFNDKNTTRYLVEYPNQFVLKKSDLIIVLTDLSYKNLILGRTEFVEFDGLLLNQRIAKIIFNEGYKVKIYAEYLRYLLNTQLYRDQLISYTTGATVNHTSPTKVRDRFCLVPPIEEQGEIAKELKKQEFRITELIGKIRNAIDILKEYRTALISAAVTGKIDVREEAA